LKGFDGASTNGSGFNVKLAWNQSPAGVTNFKGGDTLTFDVSSPGLIPSDFNWTWGTSSTRYISEAAIVLGDTKGATNGDYYVRGTPTPEPTTLVIWSVLGGVGLAVSRWRKRKAA
jgi:hypothetical protein